MKISREDYIILVRMNKDEEFKEVKHLEHCTEEMTVGIYPEVYITHWITFVDENGTLRKMSFENEDVRFVFVDKIQPIINTTVNNTLSEEMVDNLTNIAMAMRRRGLE